MPCPRVRSALALVALLALTLPALPVSADTTVTDPGNRFSFQLPDSWQTLPGVTNADVTVLAVGTTNPDGGFSVTTFPGVNSIVSAAPTSLLAGEVQNDAPVTVAGEDGTEYDVISTDAAGAAATAQQLIVMHNGTTYLLTFAAKPEAIDAVRAAGASILTSWQWLG